MMFVFITKLWIALALMSSGHECWEDTNHNGKEGYVCIVEGPGWKKDLKR